MTAAQLLDKLTGPTRFKVSQYLGTSAGRRVLRFQGLSTQEMAEIARVAEENGLRTIVSAFSDIDVERLELRLDLGAAYLEETLQIRQAFDRHNADQLKNHRG